MNKPKVETFIENIFGVNCDAIQRHFTNSNDRTTWYRVTRHGLLGATMHVPGMNVLKVNQMELDKFLAAVESFIHFPLDDPRFDWDHLNLFDYSGEQCEEGLLMLRNTLADGQLVGTDTETKYLNWDNNKLLSIGFATTDDTCHAFYNIPKELYPLLQEVLAMKGPRFAWHNGKFDKNFLWYTCGIRARVDEDSMLKHFAQVSEKKGTHGLKYLGPLYLQAPQWDDELDAMKKKFCREHKIRLKDFTYDMIPTSILIPYMHRDCIATRRLIPVLDELKEPGTDRVYDLLIRATEAFSCMEINGAEVDLDHLHELDAQYTKDLADADAEVSAAVAQLWNPAKYARETGAKYVAQFNLGSPKQLKWMLKEATGVSVDSSDAATISKLSDLVESGQLTIPETSKKFLSGIMRSRKASKYKDTYVTGMLEARREDGRVSGKYNLHGTETGRLSSSEPNMQNIPRNKDVKNTFIATPGYQLVQLDYSQAELRVLGVLSQDEFLIDSYVQGKDLHGNVAQKIFGPNYTKEDRTKCKTINFGIAYGRGAGAIAEAFKMPKSEAQKIIDDWFKAMPKVKEYIMRQRKAADRGERQQTMFGRVRHYVRNDENAYHIQNEYINTPIQSMASDLTVTSLVTIHEWLVKNGLYDPLHPETSAVRIVITVHDSIVLEVADRPELVEKVAKYCQWVMAEVPKQMIENCPLPFKADIETGYAWGKVSEPDWA